MLRARRAAGPAASFAQICRPHLRYPHQFISGRSFATTTDSDDPQKPPASSDARNEDILSRLNASSKKLQNRIRKLEKEAEAMKSRKSAELRRRKKPIKQHTPKSDGSDKATTTEDKSEVVTGTSSNDNFDEALDAVRRVYGVEKSSRPRRRRKKGPKFDSPSQVESAAKESKSDKPEKARTWGIDQKAGLWTSLREKLQHRPPTVGGSGQDPAPFFQVVQEGSVTEFDDQLINPEPEPFDSPTVPTSPKENTFKPLVKEVKKVKKKNRSNVVVNTINPRKAELKPVGEHLTAEVPRLAYNLDKVLFNPGVYHLQDQRSRVYNFDPYLGSIMPVQEFDFNALKEYVTSSKDSRLRDLSAKYGTKYCGSTSSMTAVLSHFHFLLSSWRKPNFEHLSRSFHVEHESFTVLTRGPAAAFARYHDGVYAIDADKEFDTANILSMLGKSMEKLLTLPKEEFEKYRRTRSHQLSEEEKNAEEAFHYTTFGDFMMRSQLDAHDSRLPGSGMFDLKTRAVVSIRMDVGDYEKGVGYEIVNRFGTWESFEREYYDMIRAAFLKYSLQVRMGRMDGIFVAFHNTQRIFGFQYISLDEMDRALHGTSDRRVGDEEFKASLTLLNDVLNRATKRFPGRSLRLHVETRPTNPPLTYFFAEAVDEEQIDRTQATGKASVAKFEKEILGLSRKELEAESRHLREKLVAEVEQERLDSEDSQDAIPLDDPQRQRAWDEMMAKVDDTVENDSLGLQTVRDAIEQALEQSGLLVGQSEPERNAYLNELVEALAEELSDGKEWAKELDDTPQIEDEAAQSEDVETSNKSTEEDDRGAVKNDSGQDAEAKAPGPETSVEELPVSPSERSQGLADDGSTETSETSTEATGSAVDENLGSTDDNSLSDPSLKDLILKVARGVDNKASNVGAFERVLSELVEAQAKQASAEAEEAEVDDEVDDDANTAVPEKPAASEDSEAAATTRPDAEGTGAPKKREILGMYITVRNKVDNEVVERVVAPPYSNRSRKKPQWVVEYTVTELPDDRAKKILSQLKTRRRKVLNFDPDERNSTWHTLWHGRLARSTAAGQKYRKLVTKEEKSKGLKVAWAENSLHPAKR
ncbi:hypothetical protein ACJ41O_013392 [Fusarium nematophilum]